MQPKRFAAWASTLLVVVGALLVGDALHVSVVTGRRAFASPATALRLVPGVVLIWIGSRLQSPIEDYVGADEGEGEGEGFDPETSPLGEAGVERLEGEGRE